MDAKQMIDLVEAGFAEANKNPEVIKICKALNDITCQYEVRGKPEYDHWQQFTDNGLILHRGKSQTKVRIVYPSAKVFMDIFSGKIPGVAATGHGVLIYGPLPVFMKMTPITPFLSEAFLKVLSKAAPASNEG